MKSFNTIIALLVLISSNSSGQVSNGQVSSLVAAENYFAATVKAEGLREGFLKVSDNSTLVFRPNPVKAEEFYDKKQIDPGLLSWEGEKSYGQYFSIWRANKKGVWKLALDIGTPHPKPTKEPDLDFIDPQNSRFFRQISPVRLQQREDMIMASDKLFASSLTKSTALGYNTFLGDEARLIFPGFEPITGKENITKFLIEKDINIYSEPVQADRSIGSDLAYTYGTAQITRNNKTAKYNYVRVWESQEGFKWNVIVELFSPAE